MDPIFWMRKLGYREASNLPQISELLHRSRIKTQASCSTAHALNHCYRSLTKKRKKKKKDELQGTEKKRR